jgi:hypothetical protein
VYCAGTASAVAVAVAMVGSPRVAVSVARLLEVSSGVSVACSVESALLNVPNAEIWVFSVLDSCASWLFSAAPCAVVSVETMALMSSPEPMPVEEMTAWLAAALDADELEDDDEAVGVVEVELAVGEMVELIALGVLSRLREGIDGLKGNLSKTRTRIGAGATRGSTHGRRC